MNLLWELQLTLAAVAGLVAGLLIMWLMMRTSRHQKQQHETLMQKFSDYRSGVDQHFIETAAAVDELNRSYQKVVHHLSSGAQNLMGKEALQEQLAKRSDKSVTVAYLAAGDAEILPEDGIPPPPYTDATDAEVVPLTGQPDRVADQATATSVPPESDTLPPTPPPEPPVDLQQPKS